MWNTDSYLEVDGAWIWLRDPAGYAALEEDRPVEDYHWPVGNTPFWQDDFEPVEVKVADDEAVGEPSGGS